MDINNWVKICLRHRNNILKTKNNEKKYLLANFRDNLMQKDIEKTTKLTQDFFRVFLNVKNWDKNYMKKKGLGAVNFLDNAKLYKSMADTYDIPLFTFCALGGRVPLYKLNNEFICQIKSCMLRCPWCFNPFEKINGHIGTGKYFAAREIVDVFEKERIDKPLHLVTISGGEPTLTVDIYDEINKELDKRGLINEACLSSATNLMTGHFIEHLAEEGILPKNIFSIIGEYRTPQILCSFKGTDTAGFLRSIGFTKLVNGKKSPNMKYAFLEEERWYTQDLWIESGVDVNPLIYDVNPRTLPAFIEKGMRRYGPEFLLKTWLAEIKLYAPENERLRQRGLDPKKTEERYRSNLENAREVMQDLHVHHFGLNYQAIPRPAIRLKI